MKKAISVLSIVSVILAAAGLVGILVCIVGQDLLKSPYLSDYENRSFVVPAGEILHGFAALLIACLLLGGKNAKGAGMEITTVIILLVIPRLTNLASRIQRLIVSDLSIDIFQNLSAVQTLCVTPAVFCSLAISVMLFTCGLRVACKKNQQHQAAAQG